MGWGVGYGKILLVGGYTILEQGNRGLILSLENARITVYTRPHGKWRVESSYGTWEGDTPSGMPEELRFVMHSILESGVEEPHLVSIYETENMRPGVKAGLGSSAAVTVATLRSLRPGLPEDELFKRAYRAHSMAQGKIGSGFDVASSVFGTIIYGRPTSGDGSGYYVEKVRWPPELQVALYNIVAGGSDTPSMARKVMEKVRQDEDAGRVYRELAEKNNEAIKLFRRGSIPQFLEELRGINRLRRELGRLAGVEIEPSALDEVRKRIEDMGHVTVLPGAGGYDSVLVLSHDKPIILPDEIKYDDLTLRRVEVCIRS